MNEIDTIMKFVNENNGMITASMAVNAGFARGSLKYLTDKGKLEKCARGVYILPNLWEDEFVNTQNRFKRGVFSHETALFLCDLTDRTPNRFYMTFPSAYNITKAKLENIICTQSIEYLYNIGIVKLKTPSGNTVKGYCMEKSLCDILRKYNNTDIQIITDSFKRYVKRYDRNIPKLSEYAKILKVEKKLNSYLEVLL